MLVHCELRHVLTELGAVGAALRDVVVPAKQPVLASNCYRGEYAWQHSYERCLLRRASQWLDAYRHELIGPAGLLSEALSNAYAHGNSRDASMVILVELFVGHAGYVIRVGHSGQGFDVAGVLERFGRRDHYYNVGGNGIRKFNESQTFRVFFDQSGKATHLWYEPQWASSGTA